MEATREAYGKVLAKLIVQYPNLVVLDADLTKSTKTIDALHACPQRHFNMGIAESNMMGVAAGLAASDKIVFASSFAMFATGRAYEQIRNSIAYPNLNVKICATHAGISVGEDGATHQAIEDIALMRVIPNMYVFQPCDALETRYIMEAIVNIKAPCYVRLGRLAVEDVYQEPYVFEVGKGVILHEGSDIAIIATGLMVQESMKAIKNLKDFNPTLVNMHTIKPIDKELILQLCKTHRYLFTVEEHSIIGGLGSAVADIMSSTVNACELHRIGMEDVFGRSGKPSDVLAYYKLDAHNIAKRIVSVVERNK